MSPTSTGYNEIFLEIFHNAGDDLNMNVMLKDPPAKRASTSKIGRLNLTDLRAALKWSRNQLARVMNASDRAIVNWESGDPMSPVYAAKLREIQNIYTELKQLMKPSEIGPWLLAEMDEFEGQTPADLISKGETGRLWASLFYLRTGMPD